MLLEGRLGNAWHCIGATLLTFLLPGALPSLSSIYHQAARTNHAFHLKINLNSTQPKKKKNLTHHKKIPTVAGTAYGDNGRALRQHFKYSLLVCDMKRVFLLHDIMQWDLGRSAEGPCTQKCNEPIVQKTLYCTLTYH